VVLILSVQTISAGMPSSRAEWPPGVLDACAAFVAGDVVSDPPLFYWAAPERAVWGATRSYREGSSGPEIVDASAYAPPFGVITSQTCDLGEIDFEPPIRPWISIAPVYDMAEELDGAAQSLLKKGRGTIFLLHLPALSHIRSGFWVADLRIEVPIEKSWLSGRQPVKGFISEIQQQSVVERVAAIRVRPAWAEVVVEVVQRVLVGELSRLRSENRELFKSVASSVAEIGARSDSLLRPTFVQLGAFAAGDLPTQVAGWWEQLTDTVRDVADGRGLTVMAPVVENLVNCSVSRYRQFTPVPLTRYSPI
jgi:hypothetical protein